MKQGIINETLLLENIKKINMYADLEKEKLQLICSSFDELGNYYNSKNSKLFEEYIDNLKSNIDIIYNKRTKYTDILKDNINLYKKLSNDTTMIFSGGNVDD